VTRLRQDAQESNCVGPRWLTTKRILHFQTEKILAVTKRNFRLEWQSSSQFSKKARARSRFSNHKRPSGAHIDCIVGHQFSGQNAGAKSSVPSNVDSSEKHDESHSVSPDAIMT